MAERSAEKAKALSRAITATTTKSSTKVKAPRSELSVATCSGQTGTANRPAPSTTGLPAATKRPAPDRGVDKLGRLLIEVASTGGSVLPVGSLKSIREKNYYLYTSMPTHRGVLGGVSQGCLLLRRAETARARRPNPDRASGLGSGITLKASTPVLWSKAHVWSPLVSPQLEDKPTSFTNEPV